MQVSFVDQEPANTNKPAVQHADKGETCSFHAQNLTRGDLPENRRVISLKLTRTFATRTGSEFLRSCMYISLHDVQREVIQ